MSKAFLFATWALATSMIHAAESVPPDLAVGNLPGMYFSPPLKPSDSQRIVGGTTTYTSRVGSIKGTSYQTLNRTDYFGPSGRRLGYSKREGARTVYYDQAGARIGYSNDVGGSVRFFDAHGKAKGRAVKSGSDTLFFDQRGNGVGSN